MSVANALTVGPPPAYWSIPVDIIAATLFLCFQEFSLIRYKLMCAVTHLKESLCMLLRSEVKICALIVHREHVSVG